MEYNHSTSVYDEMKYIQYDKSYYARNTKL